ncbi:lipase family protein [Pseudomonas sp. CDFA 602]|uniref:lipase family protein n=1 Tax=Pseudomonas californiensis TaxID=2829823 RepID=UPI001E35316F|nr:lipase family protein [Pseudomonas californiensis]MCD5995494.1 lipase family protein [Pseudomonas californiensis]MCD6001088.1 lipase family protein [Pseudomonas californiensis]
MSINGPSVQETCPLKGNWVSFRLVDEHGNGEPYTRLDYTLHDAQGQTYDGQTDEEGYGKLATCYDGPVFLDISARNNGRGDSWYEELQIREAFPLPLSALQVAAEQPPSAHRKPSDPHLPRERAEREKAVFYHVQVRDFVPKGEAAHLPEFEIKEHRPSPFLIATVNDILKRHGKDHLPGVPLEPRQHHVIEVKALRAYNPVLSTSASFCALNNYQLSIMSTFSYGPFNKKRKSEEPPTLPPYLQKGSIGHVLHNQLAHLEKPTLFNSAGPYHLLWEEVPYSKRLEIVPYDPERYVKEKANGWDCPENVHFLNDKTDTQAFITHNDSVVLIAIRGTQEFLPDALRDADALQIPHEDGLGQAHRGFHQAFVSLKKFIDDYLKAFYTREQTILVTGHSLGGAIAVLAAEWIRRMSAQHKVVLYTYGAPRSGDSAFVRAAKDLVHHRIVNHNDPVPGVPSTWMDGNWMTLLPGTAMMVASIGTPLMATAVLLGGLMNLRGDNYEHHGEQRHYLPRKKNADGYSAILWQPGCAAIGKKACAQLAGDIDLKGDMPDRQSILRQILSAGEHSSDAGYSRAALTTLIRWIAAIRERNGALLTEQERKQISKVIDPLEDNLRQWKPESYTRFRHNLRSHHDKRFYRLTETQLRHYYRDSHNGILAMQREQRSDLSQAQKRLRAQATVAISLEDVFGDQSSRSDLDALVNAWLQLADIQHAARMANVQQGSVRQTA